MTLSRITLESFDDALAGPAPAQSADFKKGVEAGVEQAEKALAAQQIQALSDIHATLDDMAFGYAEARDELLGQIRPVLAQVAETILPTLAQESFAAHLTDALQRAFEDVTDHAVDIAVSPDMTKFLDGAASKFAVLPDPTLAIGQARLQRGDTHIMIDLPGLVTALQAALTGLEEPQRTKSHG